DVPEPEPEPEAPAEPEAEPEAEHETGSDAGTEPSQPEALPPESAAADEQAEPAIEQVGSEAEVELPDDPLVAGEAATDGNDIPEGTGTDLGQPRRLSTPALIIAGLVVLLLLGWWLHRRRQQSASSNTGQATHLPVEPGTVRFAANGPGPAAVRLKVTGKRPDGEDFSQQLPVSGPGWMAELGRQEADIDLASPTVSRRHARLELNEGRIIITDLDSTNGTRVKGVPCLPGEVFFVQADDVVELGDVKLNLQLTTAEDQ
ncbi:MAG TPA: FHA domain-containing protein, partial [Xanthomonadales bacterium]|nr:FHA domain-containing protein [Xanthomonadales bacterium]